MRRAAASFFLAFLILVSSAFTYAAVPTSINVQGILTDLGGTPLPSGSKTFSFRIYDQQFGGNQVWPPAGAEVQGISSNSEGRWTANVGAVSPLGDAVFAGAERWLDINVDGTTLPRIRLVTGPYAFRVASVDGATGGTITSKLSVGPGHTNTGANAFVAGANNTATHEGATVGGGGNNHARNNYATIGGGGGPSSADSNSALGYGNTIGGGTGNVTSSSWSTVAGGHKNHAIPSWAGALSGTLNEVQSGQYGVIAGGTSNTISTGNAAFIGGGQDNVSTSIYGVIAGGYSNTVDGQQRATVGGGANNRAGGWYSVVSGGGADTASGYGAMVPGGLYNVAGGDYSFAAGYMAKARHEGSFVWADNSGGNFESTDADQFIIRAVNGVGINTESPHEDLTLSGTSSIAFENGASPMMYAYESGSSNPDRPIVAHSPSFPDWGIEWRDNNDAIVFQSNDFNVMTVELNSLTPEVGIGVAFPNRILQVQQNSNSDPIADAWTTYSSRRWKTNITTIENALDKVERLRGVEYDTKAKGEHNIGLIAEEVGEIIPEVVDYEENGIDAQSVDYSRLVAVLIEAVKELKADNEELRAMIEGKTAQR